MERAIASERKLERERKIRQKTHALRGARLFRICKQLHALAYIIKVELVAFVRFCTVWQLKSIDGVIDATPIVTCQAVSTKPEQLSQFSN